MNDLDPIDQQGIENAQAGSPQPAGDLPDGDQAEAPSQPQGPPCMACGSPMNPAPLAQVQFEPNLAQELGVEQLAFCGTCTGQLINWWSSRQEEVGTGTQVDTEDPA